MGARKWFIGLVAVQGVHGIIQRIAHMEKRIGFLHSMLAKIACSGRETEVTETGAWCLRKASDYMGHPLAELHFMDKGIADTILSLQPTSVLDVGAGSGQYGRYFKSINPGIEYSAVDGALNVEEFTDGFVQWNDLTKPLHPGKHFEWVMSLEVGEHLPPQFEAQFFENLKWNIKGVILSWAVEGQPGKGHVNGRANAHVIQEMQKIGYSYDEETSQRGRSLAEWWWFKDTFMVFRRRLHVTT